MTKVLSYELSAVPLSLFHLNGDMRKTNKSVLLHELEIDKSITTVTTGRKQNTGFIIDLMAFVQSMTTKDVVTFDDFSNSLCSVIKQSFNLADFVAVVPDRYDFPYSIKSFERSRRNTFQYPERLITGAQMKVPANFKGFLSNPRNKMHLIKFLFNDWEVRFRNILVENQRLLLSLLDGSTITITNGVIHNLSLSCDHEEADSKMFVFASYMVSEFGVQRIILSSPDTDVAVLCCFHFYKSMEGCLELFFKTGIREKQRFIPVHDICNQLGASICNLLPVFHCITGCDSTSSFSGIGKKNAFKVLLDHKEELMSLSDIGDSSVLDVDSEAVIDAIKFVSWLYCPKSDPTCAINELRYRMFCQKKASGEKLPPTHDALMLHIKRVNYQCYIWKQETTTMLNMPSPIGNGWILDSNENLVQHLMENPPAPQATTEFTICKCQKGCLTKSCSCRKYDLLCTDACICSNFGCENDANDSSSDTDDVESGSD